jgi:putative membrane protein
MIKKLVNPVYEFENKEEIILRDYLALERTRLANERTLLSYIRGAIYLLLGGITFLQLEDFKDKLWIGLVSLILSMVLMLIGIIRFYQLKHSLESKYFRSMNSNSTNP